MKPKYQRVKYDSVKQIISMPVSDCRACEKDMEKDIKLQITQRMMLLICAYLMDEPEFNFDQDRLIGVWDGLARYSEAIDDKLITLQKVCEIMHEHTGMEIKWEKK